MRRDKWANVLYRKPAKSDGSKRCVMCKCMIPSGEMFEQQATSNEQGKVEYWVNVCLLDVVKQEVKPLAMAA